MRMMRIIISLVALAVPTWSLLAGYESVFVRMQILTALLSGAAITLIFWLIVTLVYGRIYCSTVCPMGTLMDCIGAANRLCRKQRKDFRYALPSNCTRICFLIMGLASLLGGTGIIPTLLDPYSSYSRMVEEFVVRPLGIGKAWEAVSFTISSLAVAIVTAVAVVLVSLKRGRLACNTVCPVGTILGVVGNHSYFHIEIDPDKCINCGECERVCKSQCIKLPEKTVSMSRCVVCFDCTAVCPNAAITYKAGKYKLDMPMLNRIEN